MQRGKSRSGASQRGGKRKKERGRCFRQGKKEKRKREGESTGEFFLTLGTIQIFYDRTRVVICVSIRISI
jgi:hypothetical protein